MTAAAVWALARRFGPWIAIAVLVVALLLTRAALDRVKLEAKVAIAKAEKDAAISEAVNANRTTAAIAAYADKATAMQPLIVRSTDTVREYAQTTAGRAPCAAPDRVLGIDQLDAALWPQAAASGRSGAVPAVTGSPATGRLGERR